MRVNSTWIAKVIFCICTAHFHIVAAQSAFRTLSTISTVVSHYHTKVTGITTVTVSQGSTLQPIGTPAAAVDVSTKCLSAVFDPQPSAICRYNGSSNADATYISIDSLHTNRTISQELCAARCLSQPNCVAFNTDRDTETSIDCWIYDQGGDVLGELTPYTGPRGPFSYFEFYQRNCDACSVVHYTSTTFSLATKTLTIQPYSAVATTTIKNVHLLSISTRTSMLTTTITPSVTSLPPSTTTYYCGCNAAVTDVPNGSARCGYGGFPPNGQPGLLNWNGLGVTLEQTLDQCGGQCAIEPNCLGINVDPQPYLGHPSFNCYGYYGGNVSSLQAVSDRVYSRNYWDKDCFVCETASCQLLATQTSIYYQTPPATPRPATTSTTTTTVASLPSPTPTESCNCTRSERIIHSEGTMCNVTGQWTSNSRTGPRDVGTPEECSQLCYNTPGCVSFNLDLGHRYDYEGEVYVYFYRCDRYYSSPPKGQFRTVRKYSHYWQQECFECVEFQCTKTVTSQYARPTRAPRTFGARPLVGSG